MTKTRTGGRWALRGGRVILPDGVLENATITVANGKIEAVSTSTHRGTKENLDLDLADTTILPGFIDIHIHGAVGVDTLTATSDDLLAVSHFLASQGVTGWVPTLVPAPLADYQHAVTAIQVAMQEQRESRGALGARVLGVHYEGPFVNVMQCGALRSEYFKVFSGASDLESLPTPESRGTVRFITIAPEIEGGIELIRELTRQGWIASIGHTRSDVETLDRAFDAGARHMTHFMNAMPQVHHRNPGPVGWGLSRYDVTCDLIADGIHLNPLILRLLKKVKGSQSLSLISDAIAAAGKGDGEYHIWDQTITVNSGRTSNTSGNIAGSVITMLDAVRMMGSLDVSDVEIARMASLNPARLLGLDNECGSVEVGKRADLVALDQNRNVRLTIVGGEVVYEP